MRIELREGELILLFLSALGGIAYYFFVARNILDGRVWFTGFFPAVTILVGILTRPLYARWMPNAAKDPHELGSGVLVELNIGGTAGAGGAQHDSRPGMNASRASTVESN